MQGTVCSSGTSTIVKCCLCRANRKPYHNTQPQVCNLKSSEERSSVPANVTKRFQKNLNSDSRQYEHRPWI